MKEITRKNFLRTLGAVAAGGAVAGVSGALMLRKPAPPGSAPATEQDAPVSPWTRVNSFAVPGDVRAIELHDGTLYVATPNAVLTFDPQGKALHRFEAGEVVRDMAAGADGLYLLYPSRVEVCGFDGSPLRSWEACSEQANYCSLAIMNDDVFVSDTAGRNICRYSREGDVRNFIGGREPFQIPSLSFGLACMDGHVYCSNSGRHRVERYTPDGDFAGAFGAPGGSPGYFAGCCNPVHLTAGAGEIITSEKGVPRISCYGSDGAFRSLLLDSRMLGGGHAAYQVRIHEDRLYAAGRNQVSIFRYDPRLAGASACGACGATCPLRRQTLS
jgi:hypothetical protein